MEFSIREAIQEDYEELCEAFEQLDALHRETLPHIFQKPEGPARTREFITGIIKDDNAALFLAEKDNQIIGLIHVLIREARNIPIMVSRRYAVIDNLVVRKKFRRSEVGGSLMERAHRWVQDKGIAQIQSTVWEFNKEAIAFYNKLGYTTASRMIWKWL